MNNVAVMPWNTLRKVRILALMKMPTELRFVSIGVDEQIRF